MFDHFYIEEEEDADHQEDENTANDMSNAAAKDALIAKKTSRSSSTRTVPSEDDWRPPSPFDQWVNGTRPVVEQQPHLEGLQLEDTLDFHPNLDRLHSQRFLIAMYVCLYGF